MQHLKQLSALLFTFFLFTAFTLCPKLTLEGAKKAVKEFVIVNNASAIGAKVHITEVISVESVMQSSLKDGTCWVKAKGKVANSEAGNASTGKDCMETELRLE